MSKQTTIHRFANGHVALADGVVDAVAIEVSEGRITGISALEGSPCDTIDLDGGWIVPGFIDIQVNGGGGVLFNDDLSVDAIARIGAAHRAFGTTAFLPTLISETPEIIARAMDVVDEAIAKATPGVLGIHVEGPVLNRERKGIHDADKFRPLDDALLELFARPRRGAVLVTLAPERVPNEQIAALVAAGVRVSAGHSEADMATARAAFDAGLSGITHLFNAMPPLRQRVPGLAGAALDDQRPWCSLIADRYHVDPAMLRIAMRARPFEKMLLVTDAMPPVGTEMDHFMLHGRRIEVRDGRCTHADGTIGGSTLDMATAFANCVEDFAMTPDRVAMLAAGHAADFLGLSAERGRLGLNLRADWVRLDRKLKPVETVLGGSSERTA